MSLAPEIIYEDEDILAVNKPAGLVVHPDGHTEEPSVSEWFAEKYPKSKKVGEPIKLTANNSKLKTTIERPGIVHRIDRETSGVLLLAKTDKGHEVLKKQFQNREIEKKYHAFVYGLVKDNRGTINLPISRSSKDFRKWTAETRLRQGFGGRGRATRGEEREALTYFEVLKRSEKENITFVEAKPKTGRTHQIRVHFLALHHPVVCDSLYAPSKPALLNFKRLALHARSLTFKDVSGDQHQVLAEYPEDFRQAMDKIGYNMLD